MWGSSRVRFAVAAALVVVGFAVPGAVARAADGDLFVDGCLARAPFPGCGAGLPANPVGIAVSPDGNQVYAAMASVQDRGGLFTGLQILDRVDGGLSLRPNPDGCFVATNAAIACTKVGGANNPGE